MAEFTILCVDDEKTIIYSLKEQLRKYLGISVNIETAESGDEALEILQELIEEEKEIPIVISDYLMPGMKGDELLIQINGINSNIYKILLTGQATLEGVTNAINNANLYRYIGKPWVKEDLELAISEAIKSYKKDRQLEIQHRELEEWSNAFIETMGTTLDRRDARTAGHSKRLAKYAVRLAHEINEVNYGKYKELIFSDDEINELYFAALLHDIGKIGVRESVLLKENKLSNEKQETVKYKFNWLKTMLELKQKEKKIEPHELELYNKLDEYLTLILSVCKKEYLNDEEEALIKEIGTVKFKDIDSVEKTVLDDFELMNLLVKRGNLTSEERKMINSHVEHTYSILKGLPWPKKLSRVPEFAAGHHERLDGSGYFKGLKDEEIPVQTRILALLDVFEALTALDRPYKSSKSYEESIAILKKEVERGLLDKDLFEIFLTIPQEEL